MLSRLNEKARDIKNNFGIVCHTVVRLWLRDHGYTRR
jgi:hypothetical protein